MLLEDKTVVEDKTAGMMWEQQIRRLHIGTSASRLVLTSAFLQKSGSESVLASIAYMHNVHKALRTAD